MIDDVLKVSSEQPLNIHYTAARGPERGRATDRLYLNYVDGEKTWKQGETISRYRAKIQIGP